VLRRGVWNISIVTLGGCDLLLLNGHCKQLLQ
jgi:hypothetical protein